MFSSKKGLATYLLVLLILSFFMSLLLVVILDFAYTEDHAACTQVSFTASGLCKENGIPKIVIKNSATEPLSFLMNEKKGFDNQVAASSEKEISMREKGITSVLITPEVLVDGVSYQCKARSETINLEVLTRC